MPWRQTLDFPNEPVPRLALSVIVSESRFRKGPSSPCGCGRLKSGSRCPSCPWLLTESVKSRSISSTPIKKPRAASIWIERTGDNFVDFRSLLAFTHLGSVEHTLLARLLLNGLLLGGTP